MSQFAIGKMRRLILLSLLAHSVSMNSSAPRPHILMLMIDDLGYYDTQVHNNNAYSPVIGRLANEEGLVLERHYVYMYCSPTRRAFTTGRFPTSINPKQASPCDNLVPANFTWLSQKLKQAHYVNHFVGKGHLGYTTTDHLPINRGYDSHVGYLGGAEQYDQAEHNSHDFWNGSNPAPELTPGVHYSTNYYSQVAVNIIENHDTSMPLFLDLRYQGVHGPYVEPPEWEQLPNTSALQKKCGPTYTMHTMQSMVRAVDSGIANVTAALKKRGMWDKTLVIFTADNGGGAGGSQPSNNYPLRGTKAEPWEGGIRAAAFVSGGFLPTNLRGTRTSAFFHVADWYPTLCNLAGVDPEDAQVYNGTVRPIDGMDLWPVLTGVQQSLGRQWLPVTNQSIIFNSTWKLITGAPSTHWSTPGCDWQEDHWPCRGRNAANHSTMGVWQCMVCTDVEPCLFNIIDDPQERHDVSLQHPNLVRELKAGMWNTESQHGRNFPPYTHEELSAEEAEDFKKRGFTCLIDQKGRAARQTFWGGYAGPCCTQAPPSPTPPTPAPGTCGQIHNNARCKLGPNYATRKVANSSQCCEMCKADSQCRVWNFFATVSVCKLKNQECQGVSKGKAGDMLGLMNATIISI